ncbi:hypothetical protein Scep_030498 [Stephania cephalantha]|uniref:Uncharacterized protein n=1 Tax=Stephania cephalantha TaxID=152367 RepID=A0AAP0HGJ3_9MAGN
MRQSRMRGWMMDSMTPFKGALMNVETVEEDESFYVTNIEIGCEDCVRSTESNGNGYTDVLLGGPRTIMRHYLTVQPGADLHVSCPGL